MRLLLFIALLGGAYYFWDYVYYPFASEAERSDLPVKIDAILKLPVQRNLITPQIIPFEEYNLTKLASYEVTARILSKANYRWGNGSDIAPVDLALGWGLMADKRVLKEIKINQYGRFYHWFSYDFPLPQRDIEMKSANVHIIPANDAVKSQIKWLHKGQIVGLLGYLVNVQGPNSYHWESSTTRDDTGPGACEIFYVQKVVVY